jgi:hypothetical protein
MMTAALLLTTGGDLLLAGFIAGWLWSSWQHHRPARKPR